MFDEAKSHIKLIGSTLSVDDSVLYKPTVVALVGHLITLYYTDVAGQHFPTFDPQIVTE